MPHVLTHAEYADMVFVYGFCNGNALAVCREYSLQNTAYDFLTSEYQNQACLLVFTTNCVRMVHFPAVISLLNLQTNKMWMK